MGLSEKSNHSNRNKTMISKSIDFSEVAYDMVLNESYTSLRTMRDRLRSN